MTTSIGPEEEDPAGALQQGSVSDGDLRTLQAEGSLRPRRRGRGPLHAHAGASRAT
jgi:hypothetical protein